jgi:ABC-type dipeptide/oligopeptide/nickel transport system permease subunit
MTLGFRGPGRGFCSAATPSGATCCRESSSAHDCRRRGALSALLALSSTSGADPEQVAEANPPKRNGLTIIAWSGDLDRIWPTLILSTTHVFTARVAVLALVGWLAAARGVRGIVRVEARAEYAEAAHALGAGSWRVIAKHLLPATRGFLAVR